MDVRKGRNLPSRATGIPPRNQSVGRLDPDREPRASPADCSFSTVPGPSSIPWLLRGLGLRAYSVHLDLGRRLMARPVLLLARLRVRSFPAVTTDRAVPFAQPDSWTVETATESRSLMETDVAPSRTKIAGARYIFFARLGSSFVQIGRSCSRSRPFRFDKGENKKNVCVRS